MNKQIWIFIYLQSVLSGFGGLDVACWPLVPKFAGSNPAEAVGFFREKKILSTPSFGREVKLSVPYRRFRHVKDPWMLRGSRAFSGKIHRPFLVGPPFTNRVSGRDCSASGGIGRRDPTTIQYNTVNLDSARSEAQSWSYHRDVG